MEDIRLVQLEARDGMAFGVKETVGTLVAGGILMMVGIFAYSKVAASINTSGFTAQELVAYNNVRTNVTSGFDLGSVVFIVIAASAIIGVIWVAFQ